RTCSWGSSRPGCSRSCGAAPTSTRRRGPLSRRTSRAWGRGMPERAAASLPWPPGKSAPVLLCTCCGEPLAAGTDVCPKCNTDVRGGARSQAARGSLLLGLLGLAVLPIIFSIPAIVLALFLILTVVLGIAAPS